MDWTQWTANLVTTLITSTVVGAIIMWYLKRIHEKVDNQERDLTTLKDSRVRQLELKVDEHLKDERVSIVDIAELKKDFTHVSRSVDKIYDVTARLVDETAEQRQQLKDARNYNENLHKSIDSLRSDIKDLMRRP